MFESSPACPGPNYSHIVYSPEGPSPISPQLNYITDIILELKAKLVKIKAKVKEIKNQLTVAHLFLINEVMHSGKASSGSGFSTPFQHKYPFQNSKNKIPFPLHDIKIQKEVGEKSGEKSTDKIEKEEKDEVQTILS